MSLKESIGDCPCGSHNDYRYCCKPVQIDPRQAQLPEALMRARFTSFIQGNVAVLLATWDPSTRPSRAELELPQPQWLRLDVEASDSEGNEGWVSFRAVGHDQGRFLELRETSRFRYDDEAGQWFYIDGDAHWQHLSAGRNAPCPCGSSLKAKRCCARG